MKSKHILFFIAILIVTVLSGCANLQSIESNTTVPKKDTKVSMVDKINNMTATKEEALLYLKGNNSDVLTRITSLTEIIKKPTKEGLITIKAYVLSGENLNKWDLDGHSPLHVSVEKGWIDITEILLKAGARPDMPMEITSQNMRRKPDITALSIALEKQNEQLIQLLLKHGAKPNAGDLHDAVRRENIDQVKMILNLGVPVNALRKSTSTGQEYNTALGIAYDNIHRSEKFKQIQEYLLANGGKYYHQLPGAMGAKRIE